MNFLAEYDFGIKYRSGGKNGVADFLSRLRAPSENEVARVDEGDLVCNVE